VSGTVRKNVLTGARSAIALSPKEHRPTKPLQKLEMSRVRTSQKVQYYGHGNGAKYLFAVSTLAQ
jgi:hypothetical protein